jgi:hypothetical protein
VLSKTDAIELWSAILEFAGDVGCLQYQSASEFASREEMKTCEKNLHVSTVELVNVFQNKVFEDLQDWNFGSGICSDDLVNIDNWSFEKPPEKPKGSRLLVELTDDDTGDLAKCILQAESEDAIESHRAKELLAKLGIQK